MTDLIIGNSIDNKKFAHRHVISADEKDFFLSISMANCGQTKSMYHKYNVIILIWEFKNNYIRKSANMLRGSN